jgi:hypothetical protein
MSQGAQVNFDGKPIELRSVMLKRGGPTEQPLAIVLAEVQGRVTPCEFVSNILDVEFKTWR